MLMILVSTSCYEFRVRISMWFELESLGTPVFILSRTEVLLMGEVVMTIQVIPMVSQLFFYLSMCIVTWGHW